VRASQHGSVGGGKGSCPLVGNFYGFACGVETGSLASVEAAPTHAFRSVANFTSSELSEGLLAIDFMDISNVWQGADSPFVNARKNSRDARSRSSPLAVLILAIISSALRIVSVSTAFWAAADFGGKSNDSRIRRQEETFRISTPRQERTGSGRDSTTPVVLCKGQTASFAIFLAARPREVIRQRVPTACTVRPCSRGSVMRLARTSINPALAKALMSLALTMGRQPQLSGARAKH